MVRESMRRGALAGHAAVVGLLVLCGTAAPLTLHRDARGFWALDIKVALADRGRGGGSDDGSRGERVLVDERGRVLQVAVERGVAATRPHGGARPAASGDPVQAGGDLTPAEEAALIQGGWR